MTPEREAKFKWVIAKRQSNLAVVLENVHDPHNVGAVLRTCDSVGVSEIFVLYTEPQLNFERLELGKRSSSGARRWVDVHFYTDLELCFAHIQQKYEYIFSTHLEENAKPLHELDLSQSVALLFGNEKDGLSQKALSYSNGNFIIPQVGMVESLNISVACAVTLYEAYRQRKTKGFYDEHPVMGEVEQDALFKEFTRRHELRDKRKHTRRVNP